MLPLDLDQPDPELMALFHKTPVLVARLKAVAPPPLGPQVGFAGVAKPWKVERALQAAGCELADFASFPDHAGFSDETLKLLEDRARLFGAGLLTTEKDWARLSPEWRAKVAFWPVRAVFDDEAALDRLLTPVI
jgi:tetraacyldisaccharide 4'-kinase